MTLKHLVLLSYVVKHCASVDFLIKMDDDVFVDFDALSQYTTRHYPSKSLQEKRLDSKNIYCAVTDVRLKINRNPSYMNYFSLEDLDGDKFPNYCWGMFYMTTIDVASDMLQSLSLPEANPFPIDDIYVTGYLRSLAHAVVNRELGPYLDREGRKLKQWYSIKKDTSMCRLSSLHFFTGRTQIDKDIVFNSYRKMKKLRSICGCNCPLCE